MTATGAVLGHVPPLSDSLRQFLRHFDFRQLVRGNAQ
jgi:hypothetical protein